MPLAHIESLDHEGRGIAHIDGKVIFIEGALPGEVVDYTSYRRKPSYEKATITRVVAASSQRVAPACPHFGVCGGCSMQHLQLVSQTAAKQRVLEDAFWHIGRLRPDRVFSPIGGVGWAYRQRARLSMRLVAKKGGMLVGFHEKSSSYVAVMDSCAILPPKVSALIPSVKTLIAAMSTPDRLPQLEVAVGDRQTVLVLRHLEALTADDERRLREFADRHEIVWYLQPKGPETAWLFYPPTAPDLTYSLPDFDLSLRFAPTEFTQVNIHVNRMLVRRAMALLQPRVGERIADLFCGLGNFTLPIARHGATVVGIEGSAALVQRAAENARRNGLENDCTFDVANLFEIDEATALKLAACDKWLVDPPRDGALALVKSLPSVAELEARPEDATRIARIAPKAIVYVSCNPATLARDAAVLVHEKGYRLCGAGIVSMFAHTSHVESIALFERID